MMNIVENKENEENAINFFNSGYNCAQSVLLTFADLLKINKNTATDIASGFGAGMGRLQSTCGAVTGAYMVFGLFSGNKFNDNTEIVENTYQRIQHFNRQFTGKNGTTECRLLINCDLNTQEGIKKFKENNLKKTVCEQCVKDSINLILEQLSKTNSKTNDIK